MGSRLRIRWFDFQLQGFYCFWSYGGLGYLLGVRFLEVEGIGVGVGGVDEFGYIFELVM